MGHERAVPLIGNHAQIVKFESARDPNYVAVVNNLIRMVKEVRGGEPEGDEKSIVVSLHKKMDLKFLFS